MKLFRLNSRDLGIDLGTANVLVSVSNKGIVYREPSVVAIKKDTEEVLAFGNDAKEMLGRTPETIDAIRPLKDGVIADFTATKLMLRNIIAKVTREFKLLKPRVVVGVPSGITEVEERAVQEAVISSGAREVYLIEEPMAAAIGSGLRIAEPTGNMIVDIGGGTTEVAVVSLGGIVTSSSVKIAGDEMTEDIINYAKRYLNMIIGEVTAEEVKMEIGCALPFMTELKKVIRGRDLTTGLPVKKEISSLEIEVAIRDSINKIIDGIKVTLENTPPELSSDIVVNGIMLAGGGALIKNLDKLIQEKTGIHVNIAENPLDCVAVGTTAVLENIDTLKSILNMPRAYGRM
jgi:rod shape-determining protein MreB